MLKGIYLPIIISEDNRNAYDTEYSEDCLDYFTGGWYEQEQPENSESNASDPIPTYIHDNSGKTGIYKWDGVLSGANESEAKSSLASKKWNKGTKASCIDLKCGKDYNLGDTLRVQIKKGPFKTTDIKRIIGVKIWTEYNSIGEQPIFEEE